MKSKLVLGFVLVAFASCATAAVDAEIDRLSRMGELAEKGVGSLLRAAAAENWVVLEIPSRWRLASAPDGDTRRLWEAARNFGLVVARRLERDATALRAAAVNDALASQAREHAEFAHWVAATEGYGNGFLARRAVDLAAVACARMTADMKIELRESSQLASRLKGKWETVEWRAAVLNRELGRHLFGGQRLGSPIDPWDEGLTAVLTLKLPENMRGPLPAVKAEIAESVNFFVDDRVAGRSPPATLLSSWESKRHAPFAVGLELRNVGQATALVEFRSVIGFFPEKPVIRPPTKAQQIAIEWEKEWIKKHGVDPRSKQTPEWSLYASERQAAFAQVWKEKITENMDRNDPSVVRRWNLNSRAWDAFDRVQRGVFVDQEAEDLALWKQSQAAGQGR